MSKFRKIAESSLFYSSIMIFYKNWDIWTGDLRSLYLEIFKVGKIDRAGFDLYINIGWSNAKIKPSTFSVILRLDFNNSLSKFGVSDLWYSSMPKSDYRFI